MKYIIEIDDNPVRCSDGTLLWKAQNFNGLVFDVHGLAKMDRVAENATELLKEKPCKGCVCYGKRVDICRMCIRGLHDYYREKLDADGT